MVPSALTPAKNTNAPAQGAGALRIFFSQFARTVSALTAHPATFALAVLAVIGWAACGPFAHYSETWQLWINTSTTILTFLMVFLLQNAQMRDTKALHLKIDEVIRALHGARNGLIDLENLSEEELERYHVEFTRLQRQYTEAIDRRKDRATRAAARPAAPAATKKGFS